MALAAMDYGRSRAWRYRVGDYREWKAATPLRWAARLHSGDTPNIYPMARGILAMSTYFKTYEEAFNAAVLLARDLKREVGLEKVEYPILADNCHFRVIRLPRPENRYGHELRCQVVGPDESLMGTPTLQPKKSS